MDVNGVKTWVVLARYQAFSSCGEKDGIIRVDEFKQACVMQSDGKVGSKGIIMSVLYMRIESWKYYKFVIIMHIQHTCITTTTPRACYLLG